MSCKAKQPIICVHKQLINALNMSNYVYLGILAKFHAGQLYPASLNSPLLKKCQAEWMAGVVFAIEMVFNWKQECSQFFC